MQGLEWKNKNFPQFHQQIRGERGGNRRNPAGRLEKHKLHYSATSNLFEPSRITNTLIIQQSTHKPKSQKTCITKKTTIVGG